MFKIEGKKNWKYKWKENHCGHMVFVGTQMVFWGAVRYKRAVLENVARCIVEIAQM